jgi:hypothetical protein
MAGLDEGRQKYDRVLTGLSIVLLEAEILGLHMGLEMFPMAGWREPLLDDTTGRGDWCNMPRGRSLTVEVSDLDGTRDAILDALEDGEPLGGTPTAVALDRAYSYFIDGPGAEFRGNKLVLLTSDGDGPCEACPVGDCGPLSCEVEGDGDCHNSQESLGIVEALRDAGVETLVLGTATERAAQDRLRELARAGGRPHPDHGYYEVDDTPELLDVLYGARRGLVDVCGFELLQEHSVLPLVFVDCDPVPRFGEVGSEGGAAGMSGELVEAWQWSPNGSRLTFVGSSCDRLSRGVTRVDVVYSCQRDL